MANKVYGASSLTGGVAGALDNIDGSLPNDGDIAVVLAADDQAYFYMLDADSGAAEASPRIISPDTNAGNKRWIRIGPKTDHLSNYADLNTAITAIGATEKTLILDKATTLTANAITPSTLHLICMRNCQIDGPYTLTINGPFEAGLYQVFGSSITVTFGSGTVREVYAEWWGIDGTADDVQINAAIASIDAGIVKLLERIYDITSSIAYPTSPLVPLKSHALRVIGATWSGYQDWPGTILKWSGDVGAAEIVVDFKGSSYCTLEEVLVTGDGKAGVGINLERDSDTSIYCIHASLKHVIASECTVAGIRISSQDSADGYQAPEMNHYDVVTKDCTVGVQVNNRNSLVIAFHGLNCKTTAAAPAGTRMAHAVEFNDGGSLYLYNFHANRQLTDYAIKSDGKGELAVFGGYSEVTKLLDIAEPGAAYTGQPSSINGFKHYATDAGDYGIQYARSKIPLFISGSMISNGINEISATSGGIIMVGSKLHSGYWQVDGGGVEARTWRSVEIGTQGSNRSRVVFGENSYYWSIGNATYIGQDVYYDGTYLRSQRAGAISILRMASGILSCYRAVGILGSGYNPDLSDFTKVFEVDGDTPGNFLLRGTVGTAISTGEGTVLMGSANPANSAIWIPIDYNGTTYYVPGWTDATP